MEKCKHEVIHLLVYYGSSVCIKLTIDAVAFIYNKYILDVHLISKTLFSLFS